MWQSYVGHVIVQWQCMCWSCDSAVTVQWQSCVGHVTVHVTVMCWSRDSAVTVTYLYMSWQPSASHFSEYSSHPVLTLLPFPLYYICPSAFLSLFFPSTFPLQSSPFLSPSLLPQVNDAPINHDKPSTIKKMMKPHKNVLKLIIERPQKGSVTPTGQSLPCSIRESPKPFEPPPLAYKRGSKTSSHSSRGSSQYNSDDDPSQLSQVCVCVCVCVVGGRRGRGEATAI